MRGKTVTRESVSIRVTPTQPGTRGNEEGINQSGPENPAPFSLLQLSLPHSLLLPAAFLRVPARVRVLELYPGVTRKGCEA